MTGTAEDKFVGQKLRQRRNRLGISQETLGKFEKLTFQQIQKYETGKNRISAGRLYRLAKILHVPVSYFFEGLEEVLSNADDANSEMSEADKEEVDKLAEHNKHIESDIRKLNVSFMKIGNAKLRNSVIRIARELSGIGG